MKLQTLVDSYHLKPLSQYDDTLTITGVNTLTLAEEGELSFLTNPKYRKDLAGTKATAVLLETPVEKCPAIQLVVKNPYAVLAKILQEMYPEKKPEPAIHPSAVIAESAEIGPDCHIGPHCTVSQGASLGRGTILQGNCFIGEGSTLGEDCVLYPSVTLYHGVHLGNRVRIHANSVVGSDGFGYAQENGKYLKIPQLGGVRIGDDVEIGSNTSIDRGAQTDTVIENGTIIDNLVQVAHGVEIGEHCAIAGLTGLSGSTKIGDHCTFAGGSGSVGHIEIGEKTVIMACSVVTKSLTQPGYYAGFPAKPFKQYQTETAAIRRVDGMRKKIRELEKCMKK